MKRFDLVCFDVDGTLVTHPRGKVVWQVLNEKFLGADRIDEETILAVHHALLGASQPQWAGKWREQQGTR